MKIADLNISASAKLKLRLDGIETVDQLLSFGYDKMVTYNRGYPANGYDEIKVELIRRGFDVPRSISHQKPNKALHSTGMSGAAGAASANPVTDRSGASSAPGLRASE